MPCRDDGYPCSNDSELQKRCDKVTRMLCVVMKSLDDAIEEDRIRIDIDACEVISNELHVWWTEHKRLDEIRLQKIREEAYTKLTDEELEALRLTPRKKKK